MANCLLLMFFLARYCCNFGQLNERVEKISKRFCPAFIASEFGAGIVAISSKNPSSKNNLRPLKNADLSSFETNFLEFVISESKKV